MTFVHPWLLLGGLAALVPLLIHLFDRRRPRPHPFGAISFVLRSQRRTASRLRLKRLLLYLLRTLILLALPIALARPQWNRTASASIAPRGPAATAIILDASLSMRYADGKSLFERAREEARAALRDLLAEEPATVVLCTPHPAPPLAAAFDRARLRTLLDEALPSYGQSDIIRCLELGARALEESPLPGKRLVLISSLTNNAFRLDVPPPTVQGPKGERIRPEVVIRSVPDDRAVLPNHGLVDLRIDPAVQAGPRSFQFTFTVRNFSSQPVRDLEAALHIGGRVVAKGFLQLAPNGTAQKTLTYAFENGGYYNGEITLAPDALAEDDRRAFTVNVPKDLRALVINGSPSSVRYRDEAFFVDAALDAPGSPVRETMRDFEAGIREPFENYDLVLLLNTPAPTAEDAARLIDFVQKGGGLFISMGDHIDPEQYNQKLGALLPRPLRLTKTAATHDEPEADSKAAKLGQVLFDHPLFSPFTGRAREGLTSARFYRYMLLEAEPAQTERKESSSVIAAFEDGAPAVAIARRGKGRVLLFTSTVDRDWSDFAIRTSFLPLMQRFSAFLTGALEERNELKARVGDTVALRHDGPQAVGSVEGPTQKLEQRKQDDGTLIVGPVAAPGLHRVLDTAGQEIAALTFAAALDPAASDLTRLKPDELTTYFGESSVRTASNDNAARTVPFWTWLIVAAACAFFLEGVLLRK